MEIAWKHPLGDSLDCTIELARALTLPEQAQCLQSVFGWYDDGYSGMFGGPFHFLSDVVYATTSGPSIDWWMDPGAADVVAAFEALAARLSKCPGVDRLVVG